MADLAETLLALGHCEVQVGELRRQCEQLPRAIEQAEARAHAAREAVAAQHKIAADADAARRAKERELQELESRRGKFRSQTALVKTNTEYTTLLHEIDQVTEQISEIETQILEALERADEAAERLARIEVDERDRERSALEEARALRTQLEEVGATLEERESERTQLVAVLPEPTRGRYERVCREGGLGTAVVTNQSCGRCHRGVPIQTINLVRTGELHHCGNCGRILITDAP